MMADFLWRDKSQLVYHTSIRELRENYVTDGKGGLKDTLIHLRHLWMTPKNIYRKYHFSAIKIHKFLYFHQQNWQVYW